MGLGASPKQVLEPCPLLANGTAGQSQTGAVLVPLVVQPFWSVAVSVTLVLVVMPLTTKLPPPLLVTK